METGSLLRDVEWCLAHRPGRAFAPTRSENSIPVVQSAMSNWLQLSIDKNEERWWDWEYASGSDVVERSAATSNLALAACLRFYAFLQLLVAKRVAHLRQTRRAVVD